MNPVTHAMTGWLLGNNLRSARDRSLVMVSSVIPDLDGISILLGIDAYEKYHHLISHNLVSAIIFSIILGSFSNNRFLTSGFAFLGYHLHFLCDLLGSGANWGIPYLSPFNKTMFHFPSWANWNLVSWQNTTISIICMILIFIIAFKRGFSIIECFSAKADKAFVAAIQTRFGK